MDHSFHAGRSFEPLENGMTRIKTYADGGALLSDEVVPLAESVQRIEQQSNATEQVLKAVEGYAYKRYSHLSYSDLDSSGFDEEELERIKLDKNGNLDFTIENMEVEVDETIYYVSATVMFQVDSGEPIEGSTDTYEAYLDIDGTWCIDWHSS